MSKIIGVTTATPLAMSKMASKIAEPLLHSEELYNLTLDLGYVGGDYYRRTYSIDDLTEVSLKAGETYVVSIVTPKLGDSINIDSLGSFSKFEGDRYKREVTFKKDITTLMHAYVTIYNFVADNPFDLQELNIVIEKESPIRKKFNDIEAQLGDIESALDGIIAIQENLIGGDTV